MIYVCQKRLASKAAIDSPIIQRCLLVMADFHFRLVFLPTGSMAFVADAIKRLELERGESLEAMFNKCTLMTDFQSLENQLRPEKVEEESEDFLKRTEVNRQMLIDIENSRDLSHSDLVYLFSRTHKFGPNQIVSYLTGDPPRLPQQAQVVAEANSAKE